MRRSGPLVLSLAVVLGGAVPAAVGAAKPVKAPKSGIFHAATFSGKHPITLSIQGKSIEYIAVEVKCKETLARGALSDIRMKKTKKGYRFSIEAHSSFGYADGVPDENGAIGIAGRFSRNGKRVTGLLHVKTPRCGGTGNLKWGGAR